MTMYAPKSITAALLVLTAGIMPHDIGGQTVAGTSFARERFVIRGNGTAGPYTVDIPFIGGTLGVAETSAADSLAIASWDAAAGTIVFNLPLAAQDSVVVSGAVPPEWLRKPYTRSIMAPSRERPVVSAGSSYHREYPRPFPGLRFGGSKTFEVTTGTDRAVGLNQTLRLNISGNITDDITLNAAISDQNIPITPEGDTRELSELDRVLIELRGKHFSADMGDTDLRRTNGRWQSYARRLSGAHLSMHAGGVEVFGSGAVSEGRYMSTTIAPVEGNQGPYRLIARDGNSHITIVLGTERIWINGEQLTRGRNFDYTIDYTTGEITFTESRIIGSDMRIVCDYEYTSESYRRTFFSGGSDAGLFGGRLKIGLLAAREADDPDRAVYGNLDDAARAILRAAGDSLAALSGIRSAEGDSSGTYDMVGDHLVFNQLGKGKYNASFSWVGENRGSYRYRGGGIYEFVPPEDHGPGSGASFEPITIISGPVSHSLAGVTMAFDPVPSLHLESEVSGSSLDNNSLSNLDDSDNNGGAYRFEAMLSPKIKSALPLRLEVGGKHRTRGRTFMPLDRDRSAEENRRWGLPLVIGDGREAVSEFVGGMTVDGGTFSGSGVLLNGGLADFGDSTESSRFGGESSIKIASRGEAKLTADHIIRKHLPGTPDEAIDRLFGVASATLSGFAPSAVYESERAAGIGEFSHGAAYNDIRLKLANPEKYRIKSSLEWQYRLEQAKHGSWNDSSTVRGGGIELSTGSGTVGSLRTRYAHRERTSQTEHFASDQAFIEGYIRPPGGRTSFDWSYRAGRTREASKRKNYLYTGSGRGSYRWEDLNGDGVRNPDEFIPDEHGSYYLYEETLDDYKPVNVVSLLGRMAVDLPTEKLLVLGGKGLAVRTETSVEINEKSSAPASDVFFLKLSGFRKEGKTTSGDARYQEDITAPVHGDGSVRLRFFYLDSYNAEFVTGAERKGSTEQSVRLRLPLAETSGTEITISRSLWKRKMEGAAYGDFEVRSLSADAGISYFPEVHLSVGFTFSGGSDREELTGTTARFFSAKPTITYRFSGRGKVETSYALTSVSLNDEKPGFRIPYTMARGRKEGENHDVSLMCDYRLSNRIDIVATYTGRKFADRAFENYAQAQVRTLF